MKCRTEGIRFDINGKTIIEGIDFRGENGKLTGIIGPNGSGKSTFLKNIYRVLSPTEGAVLIDNINIRRLSGKESARKMAVVAQEETGSFDFSVREIVLMGRYPYKKAFDTDSSLDREIARKAIADTGLTGLEDRSFVTLSGGEKQRVLIARALAQQAKLIILDEPTNHLDIGFKLQVFELVKELDITIVAAIHDINLAALYCDRIYVLQNGRVVTSGTPEEVFTRTLMKEVFGVNTDITINPHTGKPQIYFTGNRIPALIS